MGGDNGSETRFLNQKTGFLRKHLVIFQPSGSRGDVAEGTTLLEAARELGVEIESTCGGQMTCSKCMVRIEEGFFERFGIESSMAHLNPVLEKEKEFFRKKQVAGDNYRQSCVAEVHGPVVVFVPEESRAVKQIVRKTARELEIELKPAVRRYYVQMSPGTLEDPLGDWERLQDALQARWGLDDLTIDYYTLLTLQDVVRRGDWRVTAVVWMDREIIRVEPGFMEYNLGLAIDVGTTTVVAYLTDLDTGQVLATESMMNPQTSYGDDVMARITYAMTREDGLEKLHGAIIDGLNTLVERVTAKAGFQPGDVNEAVLVGNTCMDHIFLNIHPRYIGLAPFSPAFHHSVDVKARDFGLKIHPSGNVHVLPNEAGFVGADNVGCIIAERPHEQDEMMLLIDIGTNGEMVLGNRQQLISASCATGPAFEGAQIKHGMRAALGAIERVEIDPLTWDVRFKVIGHEEWSDRLPKGEIRARGICGSAIIELGWELYKAGVVDATGRFTKETGSPRLRVTEDGPEFVIAWADETAIGREITFGVNDMRALQLAKAAMYAGAKIMMRRMGIEKVDKVVLAGAFGSYIDKVKAMALGLVPDCHLRNVYSVGNAAGDGARIALLNVEQREEANRVARQVRYLELTVEPDFQDEFSAAMHIPHMKDEFPHLQPMLEKMRGLRNLRLLKQIPAFADVPEQVLMPVARAAQERRYKRRETIFEAGTEPEALYIVKEGTVNYVQSDDGAREQARPEAQPKDLAELTSGALLDVPALLDGRPHSTTARAVALNTRLLAIPREDFERLLVKVPQVAGRLIR